MRVIFRGSCRDNRVKSQLHLCCFLPKTKKVKFTLNCTHVRVCVHCGKCIPASPPVKPDRNKCLKNSHLNTNSYFFLKILLFWTRICGEGIFIPDLIGPASCLDLQVAGFGHGHDALLHPERNTQGSVQKYSADAQVFPDLRIS